MSDQTTILVTGGAGFVGSHLIEVLVKDSSHRVISLDNYFTGSEENHILGAEYRTGHTKDIATLIPERVDMIYHLGEYSRVAPSLAEPDVLWDLNMQGTHGVLEYWRAHGCKLVYAGSSTKFADAREDGVEGKNRAPYSWSKAANTEYIHNYGRWYNLPYSIVYFYNVYGPRERAGQFEGGYGTVIETFKQCYLNHTPCTINGTGAQTRAFTHVYDTVQALLLVGEKGGRDEYGISAREVLSLLEVANLFGLEVQFAPATASTRSSGTCDTTNLEALGWKQEYTLARYIADITE
jgi:UDP-glucose 4-epimerase